MIRNFYSTQKDFEAYLDLFFRTEFSMQLNKPSEKSENRSPYQSAITFSVYCSLIKQDVHGLLAYTTSDDQIIAGVQYSTNESLGLCFINEFFVLPEFQLKGIGSTFFQEFQEIMKSRNYQFMCLIAFSKGSIKFWEKMGFIEDSNQFFKDISPENQT